MPVIFLRPMIPHKPTCAWMICAAWALSKAWKSCSVHRRSPVAMGIEVCWATRAISPTFRITWVPARINQAVQVSKKSAVT